MASYVIFKHLFRLDTSVMAHIYSFEISKCFKARGRSENLKQTNQKNQKAQWKILQAFEKMCIQSVDSDERKGMLEVPKVDDLIYRKLCQS